MSLANTVALIKALIKPELSDVKSEIQGKQDTPAVAGTAGQVLGLDNNLKPVWLASGSGGGVSEEEILKLRGFIGTVVKDLKELIRIDLLNPNFIIDDRYVDYNTGSIGTNSDYCLTDVIPVIPNTTIRIEGAASGAQGAFYNANMQFISGALTGYGTSVSVPNNSNVCFMRWCTKKSVKANARLYYEFPLLDYVNFVYRFIYNGEILNTAQMVDGYYVVWNTGAINEAATYSVTDYMPIIPGATVKVSGGVNGSQVAYYNKNKEYVSGAITRNADFTVPNTSTIAYFRWCTETTNKSSASLIVDYNKNVNVVTVDTTKGILEGLEEAYEIGANKVIVEAGDYDIIEEYKTKYGSTYFDNYTTNYNGLANGYNDRGLWLENIEIVFAQNAFVTCEYTGNNDNVKTYFSAFAVGENVVIDGLNLVSTNCRYGIHPDFNPSTYSYFIMKNCDLSHDKGNSWQTVGAGLGYSCDWLFENCIFRTPLGAEGEPILRIHNNAAAGSKSIINFKNCYVDGEGIIALKWYGQSSLITQCFITGCSYINEPTVDWELLDQPYQNIEIISIANEKRTT